MLCEACFINLLLQHITCNETVPKKKGSVANQLLKQQIRENLRINLRVKYFFYLFGVRSELSGHLLHVLSYYNNVLRGLAYTTDFKRGRAERTVVSFFCLIF